MRTVPVFLMLIIISNTQSFICFIKDDLKLYNLHFESQSLSVKMLISFFKLHKRHKGTNDSSVNVFDETTITGP